MKQSREPSSLTLKAFDNIHLTSSINQRDEDAGAKLWTMTASIKVPCMGFLKKIQAIVHLGLSESPWHKLRVHIGSPYVAGFNLPENGHFN